MSNIVNELEPQVLQEYLSLQKEMLKLETHDEMFEFIQKHLDVFDKVFAAIQNKVEKGDFKVFYQSHVQNEKCNGAEALFRISIDEQKINPIIVFAMASYYGYERTLTGKVIKRILPDVVQFRDKISPDFRVSFNVDPLLFDKSFCRDLLHVIDSYNNEINATRDIKVDLKNNLAVELVETSSLRGIDVKDMNLLQDNGFLIMLDDYGSGNANKKALDLPFDVIKIAGKIIKDIQTNQVHKDMVSELVERYKDTNTLTLAEHVDTKEVKDFVKNLGVDKIQGYVYSEPISCKDFLAKYSTNQKQDEIAD